MTGDNPDPTSNRTKPGAGSTRTDWRASSLALSIPGLFLAGPLVGYALGRGLTDYLGWPDWWLGAATLVGLGSGAYESYLILRRLSKMQEKKQDKSIDENSK